MKKDYPNSLREKDNYESLIIYNDILLYLGFLKLLLSKQSIKKKESFANSNKKYDKFAITKKIYNTMKITDF